MKLAIVIPAYKVKYLDKTLLSLSCQTNPHFNVYIGDDHSPESIENIVNRYYDKLNILYKRFDSNFGGKDLVAHWQRCIELTQGEKWIWLFSDDDELEPTCVERFYESLNEEGNNFDVYHFNVHVIDKNSEYLKHKDFLKDDFPKVLKSVDFIRKRLRYKLNSFVVEYIFRRETFDRCGGFENFDLAWGADDATWAKLSYKKGIYTINGPRVRWRYSGDNITSTESATIMRRKGHSVINLLTYYDILFNNRSLHIWYYNYYCHMLYRVMKSCNWPDVKLIIVKYKHRFSDYIPVPLWYIIYNLIRKIK